MVCFQLVDDVLLGSGAVQSGKLKVFSSWSCLFRSTVSTVVSV